MKISLKDLRDKPGQRIRIDFNESLSDQHIVKPVIGDLVLSAGSARVKLDGQIQTIVKLQCHTCLNYFFQALSLSITEEFVYEDYLNREALSGRDRELQRADFFEAVPYDGEIDVSDVVFQSVNLAIPNYCSCGQECPGTPVYNTKAPEGQNEHSTKDVSMDKEPMDPRWNNLKTILQKDNKNEK